MHCAVLYFQLLNNKNFGSGYIRYYIW